MKLLNAFIQLEFWMSYVSAAVTFTTRELEPAEQLSSVNPDHPMFRRQWSALPIGVLIESIGAISEIGLGSIGNALGSVFKAGRGLPFVESSGNCRMKITTWGGGHCDLISMPAEKSGTTKQTKHNDKENPWNVCWWDSEKRVSGQQYFDDPGIGRYMVEFMAKDSGETKQYSVNSKGHEARCPTAGICNAKITFYRDGYNIALYTYLSVYQGNNYAGQQPGLCQGGVLDQFHKGGAVMGYTCAVPCVNEASLPRDVTDKSG